MCSQGFFCSFRLIAVDMSIGTKNILKSDLIFILLMAKKPFVSNPTLAEGDKSLRGTMSIQNVWDIESIGA